MPFSVSGVPAGEGTGLGEAGVQIQPAGNLAGPDIGTGRGRHVAEEVSKTEETFNVNRSTQTGGTAAATAERDGPGRDERFVQQNPRQTN